jgi:hypothetical protein
MDPYLDAIIIGAEITCLDANINGAEILLGHVELVPTWLEVGVVVISVDLPEMCARVAWCVYI